MDAEHGQFPFAVQVRSDLGSSNNFSMLICTGAILTEGWVFTTTVCGTWSPFGLPMIVRVGSHNLLQSDGFDYQSKRVIISSIFEWEVTGDSFVETN